MIMKKWYLPLVEAPHAANMQKSIVTARPVGSVTGNRRCESRRCEHGGTCHDENRRHGEELGDQRAHRCYQPSGGRSKSAGQVVKTHVWIRCVVHVYEGTDEAVSGIQSICVSVTPTPEGSPLNDKNGPKGPSSQFVRQTPRSSERVTPCRCWGSKETQRELCRDRHA